MATLAAGTPTLKKLLTHGHRSYWGKEDSIPADGHMIVALIAPRYAMIANSYSDSEGDVSFADEQNVMVHLIAFSRCSPYLSDEVCLTHVKVFCIVRCPF